MQLSQKWVRTPVCVASSLWALGALGLWGTAQAQESQGTASVPVLREVVVTASRSEQLLEDALPFTTVIAREDIERSQAVDLPALLAKQASIQFTQNGGKGLSSSTYLRGSANLQVLVLIDGVPLTRQDTTGVANLDQIMLDEVERVEIVRGNVSAIYGTGAIGGVIQIFTRQALGAESSGFLRVEGGSYDTSRVAAGVQGSWGGTRLSINASRLNTDGFSSVNTQQYPSENPDPDGYQNTSFNLALSHTIRPEQVLGLRVQNSDGRHEFDGGGYGVATDIYRGRETLAGWSIFSRNALTAHWRSEVTWSERHQRSMNDSKQTAYPYASDSLTDVGVFNWTNYVSLDNAVLTAGLEHQSQKIVALDSYGGDTRKHRDVVSAFAGVTGEWGQHSVQANLRQDEASTPYSETTAYVGYGFALTPQWKAIASASNAFNLPPLGYLYDADYGNPKLRPEKASSAELGVQWTGAQALVRGTWFQTRTSDLLQYNSGTFKFENVNQVRNQGVELVASGQWREVDFRGSMTLQDARDVDKDTSLVRRAKTMASLGASLPLGLWTWGADAQYTGERPDVANKPVLSAYTLFNATAQYKLNRQMTLTARVDNVFDANYQTAYGFNQPGRSAYVGLVYRPL